MNRLDASQVAAGGEIARSPRSPSFPQPTTAAEVPPITRMSRAAAFTQSMNRYLQWRLDPTA
jgi:hypothetical protein